MKTMTEIAEILDAEIATRNDLKNQMVGSLYPAILGDEINRLFQARTLLSVKTSFKVKEQTNG